MKLQDWIWCVFLGFDWLFCWILKLLDLIWWINLFFFFWRFGVLLFFLLYRISLCLIWWWWCGFYFDVLVCCIRFVGEEFGCVFMWLDWGICSFDGLSIKKLRFWFLMVCLILQSGRFLVIHAMFYAHLLDFCYSSDC